MCLVWYRNQAGCLPQHTDPLETRLQNRYDVVGENRWARGDSRTGVEGGRWLKRGEQSPHHQIC